MSNKLLPDERTKTPVGNDKMVVFDSVDSDQVKTCTIKDVMFAFGVTTTSTSTSTTSSSTSTTT